MLAIPALAAFSAAYALAEALRWPVGLQKRLNEAWLLTTLCVATLLGVALDFSSINPIKALFWSAVINGVAAVPIMFLMMLMTANPKLTGTLGLRLPRNRRLGGDRGNVRRSSRDDRYLGRMVIRSGSPGKEKPPESAPGAFEPAFCRRSKKDETSYALVRAESTPLASVPMLLPTR